MKSKCVFVLPKSNSVIPVSTGKVLNQSNKNFAVLENIFSSKHF